MLSVYKYNLYQRPSYEMYRDLFGEIGWVFNLNAKRNTIKMKNILDCIGENFYEKYFGSDAKLLVDMLMRFKDAGWIRISASTDDYDITFLHNPYGAQK